jgi:protein kinase
VLIPSASEDAVNFITSLCSWDPSKRPTALEALSHPFFQSCFYIPPSLRSKSAVTRTPPTAGTRGAIEQKSVWQYSGTLPNFKPASNLHPAKSHTSVATGVQRKLEMNNQDAIKNDKFSNAAAKPPPRYRLPARNSATSTYNGKIAREVSKTAEKLANMTVGSARVPTRQAVPAPMKAGGWHGQPHLFLGRSQEIQPGRTFSRKVAG